VPSRTVDLGLKAQHQAISPRSTSREEKKMLDRTPALVSLSQKFGNWLQRRCMRMLERALGERDGIERGFARFALSYGSPG
jgi:hypothetical protein